MLPNISPIIRIAIVSLTLLDIITTDKSTKKLPRLAAITTLHLDINIVVKSPPKIEAPIMVKATPKLAPDVMPKTKGPASGFLNNVCIISPEIPSPEPTIIAVNAFGNR